MRYRAKNAGIDHTKYDPLPVEIKLNCEFPDGLGRVLSVLHRPRVFIE